MNVVPTGTSFPNNKIIINNKYEDKKLQFVGRGH